MLNKFILLDCSICVFNQKVKYLYTQSKAQAGESRLDYSKSSVYNISCLACAQLYRCWAAVLATDTGVSRYDLQGCQASPRRCLCLNSPVSNLAQSRLLLKMVASWADPCHLETTLVNVRSADATACTLIEKYPLQLQIVLHGFHPVTVLGRACSPQHLTLPGMLLWHKNHALSWNVLGQWMGIWRTGELGWQSLVTLRATRLATLLLTPTKSPTVTCTFTHTHRELSADDWQ